MTATPNVPEFVGIIPTLPVKSVKETQDYYESVLGFRSHWIWEDNKFGSVFGGQAFEIHLKEDASSFTKHMCYIHVEDADAYFKALISKGAKIIDEIKSRPWGMREFVLEENNGHLFRIGHGEKSVREVSAFKLSNQSTE
jgi:uncharacterized glyoxalase superfamily protein PhnB